MYRLWYMGLTAAGMDAVGMTLLPGSASVLTATSGRPMMRCATTRQPVRGGRAGSAANPASEENQTFLSPQPAARNAEGVGRPSLPHFCAVLFTWENVDQNHNRPS